MYYSITPLFCSMFLLEYSMILLFGYPIILLPYSSIILLCIFFVLLSYCSHCSSNSNIILFIHRVGGETWYMRSFALPPIVAPHCITCRASEHLLCDVRFSQAFALRAFAIPFHASQGKTTLLARWHAQMCMYVFLLRGDMPSLSKLV